MQQLEYQTKTKNLSSLSRELLHSLIVLEDDYFLKQIIGKTEFEEKLTTLLDGTFDERNEVGVRYYVAVAQRPNFKQNRIKMPLFR